MITTYCFIKTYRNGIPKLEVNFWIRALCYADFSVRLSDMNYLPWGLANYHFGTKKQDNKAGKYLHSGRFIKCSVAASFILCFPNWYFEYPTISMVALLGFITGQMVRKKITLSLKRKDWPHIKIMVRKMS